MSESLNEMKNALVEITELNKSMSKLNADTVTNTMGMDLFLKALITELRERDPDLVAAISARIEEFALPEDASKERIAAKRYALFIASN